MNIQQYRSTDLTLLTAHFGISLIHNCTKIQYLLYSNCSKCPPIAMQFFGTHQQSSRSNVGWLRVCFVAAKKRSRSAVLDSTLVSRQLNRCSTWNRKKTALFSGHYVRKRSTLDIDVFGYIGIL